MKQSERPLWKKSIIQNLDIGSISEWLYEIAENGDMYGYENDEDGYYNDYKELFDDLSAGAYYMLQALQENYCVKDNWDDMTVALLGETHSVFGYDLEVDYYGVINSYEEELAENEAVKRIKRLNKDELIATFQKVLRILVLFFDLKSAHDCLTAVVQELDERGAILNEKNNQINLLYEDLTGKNEEAFDELIRRLPQRMWLE